MKNVVLALSVFLAAALGIACYSQARSLREQQRQLQKLSAIVELREREPAATLELQENCARGAREMFKAGGWGSKPLAGFTNHYSAKANKCFVQITDLDTKTSPGTTWISKTLSDAFEGKVYGEYSWESDKTKKAWEVRPVECHVTAPSGEKKSCESVEEFDALVKAYME